MLYELDPAKVGQALMGIGVAAVNLGHKHITGTVDPYLLSTPRDQQSREMLFVIDLLIKNPADVIPQADVNAVIRARPPWNPDA